jgi:NADPH-dependent 2,4-dienoyl-CoA reductase/sulfur reductase-like enzyme/nitrite reductase/ring-hydroxylating ferredoxin subunit
MHGSKDDLGPDLEKGTALSALADGAPFPGHVRHQRAMLIRRGAEVFAIGATCTHYGGPLSEGLVVGETVRCPWHHACFSLRNGAAVRAPARDGVPRWRVEQQDGQVFVREELDVPVQPRLATGKGLPESVVIVGGGAAGAAAAETLRQEGYTGRITMFSADSSVPCDRPMLSKGFLAGTATEAAVPLRSAAFYEERRIDVRLGARVVALDIAGRCVQLADGSRHTFGALLLATGTEPIRLAVPGAELPHVHYLRSPADGRALVEKALVSRRAVVIGASFIGLEVAASLRARLVEVDVVALGNIPMEKQLGAAAGTGLRTLHEKHGVRFHLGTTPVSIDERSVILANGERLAANLVVVGIGVVPDLGLAERSGLAVDRGILVNEYLETSAPGVFAAGDVARWPDPLTGERVRIEHWALAQRQGATAARNMLGRRESFDAVPFFWTEQYDVSLVCAGHAERWDTADIDGVFDAHDCTITYRNEGRLLAVASVYRDLENLRAEVKLEETIAARRVREECA